MPGYSYSFVARPSIHEKLEPALKSSDGKRGFLTRFSGTVGDKPHGAGKAYPKGHIFYGQRHLEHSDEVLGRCLVIFRVRRQEVTVYVVRALD